MTEPSGSRPSRCPSPTTGITSRDLPTAPVTLVEYGDYQCPFCGAAYPIIKEVQARMGDGLRFVFRNFPISTSHPNAERAAEAAEAAGVQGRFWEMHDLLYENQDRLDGAGPPRVCGALAPGRRDRSIASLPATPTPTGCARTS